MILKKGVLTRSLVEPRSLYADYKENLRVDFWYSCAYCSITEIEAKGIGFQIDHYAPHSKFPDLKHEYNNLMYSCSVCNRYKGDYYHSLAQKEKGYIIIRPDEDNPDNHFELSKSKLKPKTETGKFNEEQLLLNRQTLLRIRATRELLSASANYIAFGVTQLLDFNIDLLQKENRLIVAGKRNKLESDYAKLATSLEEYLKSIAKSELLDSEPYDAEKSKERKKYLDSVNALRVDYKSTVPRSNRNKRKTKKKK